MVQNCRFLLIALLPWVLSIVTPLSAAALPSGGTITSGSGEINQTTQNELVIQQNTQQLITNWDQFSIGSGQSVTFNQPGQSSVALNRVIGQGTQA